MSLTGKWIDAWKMAMAAVLLVLAMSVAPGMALAAEGDEVQQGDQPAATATEPEAVPAEETEPATDPTEATEPTEEEAADSGGQESPGVESPGGQAEAVTETTDPAKAEEATSATPTPESFNIAFNINGGSWAAAELSGQGTKGTEITLPTAGDVSRGGYTLVGWATTPNPSPDAVMAPGSTYTVNGNETLYAVWAKNATVMRAASTGSAATANATAATATPATVNMLATSGGTSMGAMESYNRMRFDKTNSNVYWSFSESTSTLTISYDAIGELDTATNMRVHVIECAANELPWNTYVRKEQIHFIEFVHDATNASTFIRPTNMSGWFQDYTRLEGFVGTALDTSAVTDFSNLFAGCTSLTSVTGVETWDTTAGRSFNNLFLNDAKIVSLNLSTWDTSTTGTKRTSAPTVRDMFTGMKKLETLTISGKIKLVNTGFSDTAAIQSEYSLARAEYITSRVSTAGVWKPASSPNQSYTSEELVRQIQNFASAETFTFTYSAYFASSEGANKNVRWTYTNSDTNAADYQTITIYIVDPEESTIITECGDPNGDGDISDHNLPWEVAIDKSAVRRIVFQTYIDAGNDGEVGTADDIIARVQPTNLAYWLSGYDSLIEFDGTGADVSTVTGTADNTGFSYMFRN